MTSRALKKSQYLQIALFALIIFLFVGTLDLFISKKSWSVLYFHSFVYTMVCTFFCSFLITRFYEKINQYPRLVFFGLFSLLVVIGIFIGVIMGTLILEQRFYIKISVLKFSLLIGFVASLSITAFMVIRENLENQISRIKAVEIENEKLKRFELEARLNSLQAKLNPHFLFNTLNSTAALIYDNPVKAEESIVRLSDLYRKVFSISNQTFITLEEEIELIEDLLALEKLRFEDHLSYHIHCPEGLKQHKIPGLIIEPLVENIIKHVHGKTDDKIRVVLTIELKEGRLHISVADNGPGFNFERTDPGFGLYSIQERLRLLFDDNAGMSIASNTGQGTKVTVWLPAGKIKD